jgi:uncharacterized protein (DUF433 family)
MLQIPDQKVPLTPDEGGVLHVTGSRVTLDCVVGMFNAGASAEEIAEEYDSIGLSDVYAVLTYCLRNEADVRSYLSEQRAESEVAQEELERSFPRDLREKLLRAKRSED